MTAILFWESNVHDAGTDSIGVEKTRRLLGDYFEVYRWLDGDLVLLLKSTGRMAQGTFAPPFSQL
jgi:hypothetical protein